MPEKREPSKRWEGGKFRFDVSISLPLIGLVIRYRGWLEPVSPSAQGVSSTGASAVAPMVTAVLNRAERPALARRA